MRSASYPGARGKGRAGESAGVLGEDAKGEFHPRVLALVSAAFPLPPGYEAEARCMFVRGGQQNIWRHLLGRQTGGSGRGLPGVFSETCYFLHFDDSFNKTILRSYTMTNHNFII